MYRKESGDFQPEIGSIDCHFFSSTKLTNVFASRPPLYCLKTPSLTLEKMDNILIDI